MLWQWLEEGWDMCHLGGGGVLLARAGSMVGWGVSLFVCVYLCVCVCVWVGGWVRVSVCVCVSVKYV